jgi:MFS transporter, DHA1 family, multidrug resistance protein
LTIRKPPLLVYPFFISLASVGAVLFTPAIPEIQNFFSVDSDSVQSTISIFLIGYALCQLIYGPISNKMGRKKALLGGILLGAFGAFLCALSGYVDSFSLLITGRLITALGTGAGLTLTFAIINDLYSYEESRRIIPVATLAFAVFPGLSIFIGGFLVQTMGWQSCFYFLFFYLLFAAYICLKLPETRKLEEGVKVNARLLLKQHTSAAKDIKLWLYASIWGLCTSVVYLFAATAPIIAISILNRSPEIFGTYNLLTSAGMIMGSFFTNFLNKRFAVKKIMQIGQGLLLVAVSILLYYSKTGSLTLNTLFFPMVLFYFAMPAVISNASALAAKEAKNKGAASALINFTNMSLTVLTLFITTLFERNVELIMPEIFFAIVLIILTLMFLINQEEKRRSV